MSSPQMTPIHCSFCGKSQDEVKKLISTTPTYICDVCVELCCEILVDAGTFPKIFPLHKNAVSSNKNVDWFLKEAGLDARALRKLPLSGLLRLIAIHLESWKATQLPAELAELGVTLKQEILTLEHAETVKRDAEIAVLQAKSSIVETRRAIDEGRKKLSNDDNKI